MKFKNFTKSLKKSFSRKNKVFPNDIENIEKIQESQDILNTNQSLDENVSIKSMIIKDVIEETEKIELNEISPVEINEEEVENIENKVNNQFVLQEGTICQLLDENILDVLLEKEEKKSLFINHYHLISIIISICVIGVSVFFNL